MKVIKRNGKETIFDSNKILSAISKVCTDTIDISSLICKCEQLNRPIHVEEIQEYVIELLEKLKYYEAARKYSEYRLERSLRRKQNSTDGRILSIIERNNEDALEENSNKNPVINSTQRDYIAGEVSKDISRRILLSEDVVKAHDEGLIHFHDMDYMLMHEYNCSLINLEDMLQNGTVINGTMIEKPHSFHTACNVATQISASVASNQYGGQTISLSHLAPFIDISRKKIENLVGRDNKELVEKLVKEEINKGVQTIQYQVNTLMTCNGQTPFISVFMYLDEVPEGRLRDDLALLIEEVLKQRIQGVKNEVGAWITPAFPKLLYCLDEDNIYPDSKYYYLTELAAKCTAKRMVPDYISAKVMKKLKGDVYPCMGCRSFLTPDPINHKYYSRFNQGVVTLNLVDVACSSKGNINKFWKLLDERCELCKKALMFKHNRIKGTPSDVAPILFQHGAIARLKKGEVVDKLLFNNNSTISLGYAGLCECTYRMKGVSHTDPKGKEFALEIMRYLNKKCSEWREETNISFSVYGTPLESTCYKFAQCLQKRFGVIPNVTDKNYITNSYHVHVTEPIDAFSKLKFESEFQELSPGGAISYIEVPNMENNIPAVLSLIRYIYDTILYAELNTKSDYCMKCGYNGEIKIVQDNNKLIWECPQCGNRDQRFMNVCRRVCGYLSTNFFNQGRTQEIKERVMHL